ncbi:phosphoglucomutase-2 [Galendromus occidentalis]|uniref:Phosphoglucomutase-2 n=1 Tax=Galendromus occidentalis TaxID=34638 RepID=A0AAJ6VYZ3_9ACAR|nr:phosphoglucomutase-2 [Galendromus occidentalis]
MSSQNQELRDLIDKWLRWDQNPETSAAIRKLLADGEFDRLRKLMLKRMTFGTAGLRGVMAEGFACMNDLVIIQTSQGLAKYLVENIADARKMGVVISFDGRHNSPRFARLTARAFLQLGVKVFLFNRVTPTPYVPFSILHFGAACGVMVTASHNPKEDNGYKVFWSNGAQIISPHDKGIQTSIEKNLEPWSQAWDVDDLRNNALLNDPTEEINSNYMQIIENNIFDRDLIKRCRTAFCFTAMHGVGHRYVAEAFKRCGIARSYPVLEQMEPDPEFPTVKFPNPEEGASALELAIRTANKNNCRIILANDPDADRLAVAELIDQSHEFRTFSGDNLGALIGWWLWTRHRLSNPKSDPSDFVMIASTVSSKILRSMAKKEGFNFEETLTGFKWMANRGIELEKQGKKVLFAFEEAIGYMCGTAVWDKDGVSAALQVANMVAYLDEQNVTLNEQLNRIFDEYGFHTTYNSYYISHDPVATGKMFDRIRNIDGPNTYPKKIGRFAVSGVRDLTVGFDSTQPGNKPILPVSSSSQMITFYMENGATITIRTSGTEPKVKWYSELITKPGVPRSEWESATKELRELIDSMVEELYRPSIYGFQARST